jgi:cephalosporin hydroxylase
METILNKLTCNGGSCDNEEFFKNHNIPMVVYDGLSIQQNNKVVFAFDKLINETRPAQIIEIGTASGGLTLMVRDLLDLNGSNQTDLITYDIYKPEYLIGRVSQDNLNIDVRYENIFNGDYTLKDEESIKNMIQQKGRTIVLCDGGNKKEEFKTLSNYLKSGDIIMAHDYAYDDKDYQENINNKIWYWHEIQNSDISESCERNNLIDFMSDEFNKVVWCCKIKK